MKSGKIERQMKSLDESFCREILFAFQSAYFSSIFFLSPPEQTANAKFACGGNFGAAKMRDNLRRFLDKSL
jgi:hypothetical protein